MPTISSPAPVPSLLRTLLFVLIASFLLVAIDSVLATTERAETTKESARLYGEGLALTRQGKHAEAVVLFKSAIAKARNNPEYRLALGRALRGAGRLDDAEATLSELLTGDSMGGAPNLALARVYAKEERVAEAAAYYHRAIYGQWKDDAQDNQVKTRFELVDFLAARKAKPELLAELLALQNLAPADAVTQQKLAGLYLFADAPARAAGILRDLVRSSPDSANIHEALAQAEFALGNYGSARANFLSVVRLRPDDTEAKHGLQLSEGILDLDPMKRGLPGHERYRRSILMLQRALDDAAQCPAASQSAQTAALATSIRAAVKRRVDSANQSDAVEGNMDLANRFWKNLKSQCGTGMLRNDEAIDLTLTKVTAGETPEGR